MSESNTLNHPDIDVDVQVSRDYIVTEQYKNNAEFWKKEYDDLKISFEKAKVGIIGRDKKITKLTKKMEDFEFEFKLFEHNWKSSIFYKFFSLFNRNKLLRD